MKFKLLERLGRTIDFLEVVKKFVYGLIMILIFISTLMFWIYAFTYSEEWRDLSVYMIQLFRSLGIAFALVFILYHKFSFWHDFLYKREIKKIETRVEDELSE